MKSLLVDSFLDSYEELPEQVKQQARKAYRLWRENPHHPGLRFKRVHPTEPVYSVRISRGWRTLGVKRNEDMYWFWIGSHDEYEKQIARF